MFVVVTVEISREAVIRLTDEAQKQGVSVEALLERLISEQLPAKSSAPPELPVWHLGELGSLRRTEIYGDDD